MTSIMLNTSFMILSLSGLEGTMNYRIHLFFLSLLCYCAIVMVNITLILTIILDKNLHEPMYIFLCNLCINGLYGTGGFYPKFFFDLLSSTYLISYTGCLLQVYVIYSYATMDFSILALMAYDRYVAICRPLEYHSIMTKRRISCLIFIAWIVPFCLEVVVVMMTARLDVCGSHIDKLYCDNWSVVKLSCASTKVNSIVGMTIIAFYFCHYLYIICTYVPLIRACLGSTEGKKKFMQTCLPHILCLQNVTIALLFDVMYARHGSKSVSQSLRNFMAVQFLTFPPLLNPIIYGLNLTKVRKRIIGFFGKKV